MTKMHLSRLGKNERSLPDHSRINTSHHANKGGVDWVLLRYSFERSLRFLPATAIPEATSAGS